MIEKSESELTAAIEAKKNNVKKNNPHNGPNSLANYDHMYMYM